jgi:hypothetical protein
MTLCSLDLRQSALIASARSEFVVTTTSSKPVPSTDQVAVAVIILIFLFTPLLLVAASYLHAAFLLPFANFLRYLKKRLSGQVFVNIRVSEAAASLIPPSAAP